MIFRRPIARVVLLLAASLVCPPFPLAAEETPYLTAPSGGDALADLPVLDIQELKKEADTLQRKANLLREAAQKKYAEANHLRQQAGGYRAQANATTQAVQARAAASQGTNELLGGLMGMLGAVSPMPTPSQSATLGLTSKLMSANQNLDASSSAESQMAASQGEMQAEKNAGPLEMKAQSYEDDGNRLTAAYNKLQSLANARLLLLMSEELRKTILQDREYLATAKKRLS
ncbi:MAG: hypothetical protein WC859_09440 [Elusimicrobiota bacterium]